MNMNDYLHNVAPWEVKSVLNFKNKVIGQAAAENLMSRGKTMQYKGSIPAVVWFNYEKVYGHDYWTKENQDKWLKENSKFKV